MKAKTNSIHARLYEFTYTSYLPVNLCPYFWKLVFAIIIFIPNFLIQLPGLIVQKIARKKKYENDCVETRVLGLALWFMLLGLILYLISSYHMIKMWFNAYSYQFDLAITGCCLNTVITVAIIIWFIQRYRVTLPYKEKDPSLIAEFIQAKKNKYCPKIDWE